MKRVKFIFIVGIIIGLLFIGGNILKGNSISSNKNNVSAPNVSDNFEGGVSAHYYFYNTNENYDLLNNSRFKLTLPNNKISFYSIQFGEGQYGFDNSRPLSFENSWDLLTPGQQKILNNIKTYKDLKDYNTKYINYIKQKYPGDYPEEEYSCYKDNDGYAYCYFPDSINFATLEQTNVSSGYIKQKYSVLTNIEIGFILDNSSDYAEGTISNIPDSASVSLGYIGVSIQPFPQALFRYDDYSAAVEKMTNFDLSFDEEEFFNENAIFDSHFCGEIPKGGIIGPSDLTKDYINVLNKINSSFNRTYRVADPNHDIATSFIIIPSKVDDDLPFNEQFCPPVIINKRGSINLNISTTVNEKTSISTTSNSRLVYKVKVVNDGITSYDNKVVSKLPDGFKYVEGTATNGGVYNSSNNTITWTLYRIDEDSYVDLSYEAYAPNGLSNLKDYISEASIEAFGLQSKVISNKATVKLMPNPKTSAPLYGIGITLIIVWGIAFYLYFDKRKKEVLQ